MFLYEALKTRASGRSYGSLVTANPFSAVLTVWCLGVPHYSIIILIHSHQSYLRESTHTVYSCTCYRPSPGPVDTMSWGVGVGSDFHDSAL